MGVKKKRCKYCKLYFDADGMIKVPAGTFCHINHALQFANEKSVKAAKKQHSADKKKFYASTLGWQHKQTQKAFNKMRVLEELKWFADRNLEPSCISCGKPLGGDQWCCGHFKTRGAQSGLRYDRRNTFLQHNRYCNMGLSGDIAGTKNTRGYRDGLTIRFGLEEGQAIIDYCDSTTAIVKWTCDGLEQMRKEFNKAIRELS